MTAMNISEPPMDADTAYKRVLVELGLELLPDLPPDVPQLRVSMKQERRQTQRSRSGKKRKQSEQR